MPKKGRNIKNQYPVENLSKAVDMVRSGLMSYRKASNMFGVPKTTIVDHVSGKVSEGASRGKSTVFPEDVENKLAEKIKVK